MVQELLHRWKQINKEIKTNEWMIEMVNEQTGKKYKIAVAGTGYVGLSLAWFKPTDIDKLLGDPTEAGAVLGWDP